MPVAMVRFATFLAGDVDGCIELSPEARNQAARGIILLQAE